MRKFLQLLMAMAFIGITLAQTDLGRISGGGRFLTVGNNMVSSNEVSQEVFFGRSKLHALYSTFQNLMTNMLMIILAIIEKNQEKFGKYEKKVIVSERANFIGRNGYINFAYIKP